MEAKSSCDAMKHFDIDLAHGQDGQALSNSDNSLHSRLSVLVRSEDVRTGFALAFVQYEVTGIIQMAQVDLWSGLRRDPANDRASPFAQCFGGDAEFF